MSLLDKTKGLLVPSGYKAGTLYGIVPDVPDNAGVPADSFDFTVERPSKANRVYKDGYIWTMGVDVPLLDYSSGGECASLLTQRSSTNLIQYPFALENTYWTKSGAKIVLDESTAGEELITNIDDREFNTNTGNWTLGSGYDISGGTLNFDASDVNKFAYYLITLDPQKSYVCTFDVLNVGTGDLSIRMVQKDANGYLKIMNITSAGTYTGYFNPEYNGVGVLVLSDNTATFSIDNVSVKEVQGFTSPFKDTNGSVQLVGRKLVESVNNERHYLYRDIPTSDDTLYSWSVIAKAGERDFIQLLLAYSNPSGYANFDLVNGEYVSSECESVSMTKLANGYWLCSVSIKSGTNGNVTPEIHMIDNINAPRAHSYQGDGTSGIYIAGTQFEEGYPTFFMNDPIEAEGAEHSRSADIVTSDNEDLKRLADKEENFTLFWEGKAESMPSTSNTLIGQGSGSAGSFGLYNFNDGTDNYLRVGIRKAVNKSISYLNDTSKSHKIAGVYNFATDEMILYADGNYIGWTSISAAGYEYDSTRYFVVGSLYTVSGDAGFSKFDTKQAVVFNTALTDEEAIELTKL